MPGMIVEGATATNKRTGQKIVYRGGKWYPMSADGSLPPLELTQDQGQAQTYGRLMVGAEKAYQGAVEKGYNPGSFRNTAASVAEGLPFGGLDGVGAVIRDDVGDLGRQAELQWSDAQLKAMSGAASPEAEVKRNVKTYFPRPGETFNNVKDQKAAARESALEGAKMRAGPAGPAIAQLQRNALMPEPPPAGQKPPPIPKAAEQAYMRMVKAGEIDRNKPRGDPANPFLARSEAVANRLPKGSYVVLPSGDVGVVE